MLKDSGVFEYNWTELNLWLDQLTRVEPQHQETVILFLERVRLCKSTKYEMLNHNTGVRMDPKLLVSSSRCW